MKNRADTKYVAIAVSIGAVKIKILEATKRAAPFRY